MKYSDEEDDNRVVILKKEKNASVASALNSKHVGLGDFWDVQPFVRKYIYGDDNEEKVCEDNDF